MKHGLSGGVCAVCESSLLEKLTSYRVEEIRLTVYRCLSCGHAFKHGEELRYLLQKYYEGKTRSRYAKAVQEELAENQVKWFISEISEEYASKDISIVEIGAGGGWFVRRLRELGYLNTVGFEPEVHAVESVREQGVEESVIINAFVDNLSELSGLRPQVVCLMHVLEHISEPAVFLLTAKAIEVDYIYIEVPNGEIEKHFFKNEISSSSYSFEHLHAFSRESLYKLADRIGYSIVKFESRGKEDFYYNPLNKIRLEKFIHDVVTHPENMTGFKEIAKSLFKINFEFLKVWIILKIRKLLGWNYSRLDMPIFRLLLKRKI